MNRTHIITLILFITSVFVITQSTFAQGREGGSAMLVSDLGKPPQGIDRFINTLPLGTLSDQEEQEYLALYDIAIKHADYVAKGKEQFMTEYNNTDSTTFSSRKIRTPREWGVTPAARIHPMLGIIATRYGITVPTSEIADPGTELFLDTLVAIETLENDILDLIVTAYNNADDQDIQLIYGLFQERYMDAISDTANMLVQYGHSPSGRTLTTIRTTEPLLESTPYAQSLRNFAKKGDGGGQTRGENRDLRGQGGGFNQQGQGGRGGRGRF